MTHLSTQASLVQVFRGGLGGMRNLRLGACWQNVIMNLKWQIFFLPVVTFCGELQIVEVLQLQLRAGNTEVLLYVYSEWINLRSGEEQKLLNRLFRLIPL